MTCGGNSFLKVKVMKSHQRGISRKSENEDKVEECVCWCALHVQKSLKHGQIAQEEHLKHMWKKHLHGETHEEPAE